MNFPRIGESSEAQIEAANQAKAAAAAESADLEALQTLTDKANGGGAADNKALPSPKKERRPSGLTLVEGTSGRRPSGLTLASFDSQGRGSFDGGEGTRTSFDGGEGAAGAGEGAGKAQLGGDSEAAPEAQNEAAPEGAAAGQDGGAGATPSDQAGEGAKGEQPGEQPGEVAAVKAEGVKDGGAGPSVEGGQQAQSLITDDMRSEVCQG